LTLKLFFAVFLIESQKILLNINLKQTFDDEPYESDAQIFDEELEEEEDEYLTELSEEGMNFLNLEIKQKLITDDYLNAVINKGIY
jgi:hypothetical protein